MNPVSGPPPLPLRSAFFCSYYALPLQWLGVAIAAHMPTDCVDTPGTTVSTGHVLLALRCDGVLELCWAESLDAAQLVAAVAALGHRGLLLHIEDVEPVCREMRVREKDARRGEGHRESRGEQRREEAGEPGGSGKEERRRGRKCIEVCQIPGFDVSVKCRGVTFTWAVV